jgi:hypothetical protein
LRGLSPIVIYSNTRLARAAIYSAIELEIGCLHSTCSLYKAGNFHIKKNKCLQEKAAEANEQKEEKRKKRS